MSVSLMADAPEDHPSGRGLRVLAVVALVAALAFTIIGVKQGSPVLIGMGVAGILLAGVTWLAPGISAFLRIFIGIFAVEYVVFGAAVAVQDLDLWPAGYEDYTLPTSLPVTVAVFGLIAWAASFIPVIRVIARITDPYFETRERRPVQFWPVPAFTVREDLLARSLVTVLVLINQAQVGISVRLSFFNRDWFNAIQEKNEPLFWSLLYTVFMVWALVYVASGILEYVLQSGLTIRWRQWLTSRYVDHWLEDGTHYKMALAGRNADNPDQRIAEDVRQFIELTYGFSIRMLATLSSLVSFSIILWTISSSFAIPGTSIVVPGFLFWVALIYAAVGTLVTHLIGRSLVPLNFAQQRYEADFRFSLARLREYGEQVALLEGELAERQLVMGRFGSVIRNFWQIVNVRKWLTAFTVTYGQISVIIPYVIVAPFYFLGKVQLGTMSQTAGAFSNVSGALTFFVDYYVNLAEYKSIVDRLNTFDGAIAQGKALGRTPPRIDIVRSPGKDLALDALTVKLPDGRAIVHVDGLRFEGGQATLLAGPSGSGKSTLLRAISGIWPYGEGRIGVPQGASVMLLPQRPYIPIGSLRNAVTYPSVSGTYGDAAIADALRAARLPELVDRIDADGIWSATLSGGEQQRLAIARALLARPDWLFLDEATSALDEANEVALYRMLRERLSGTTIVSIGHRSTLVDLHTRRLEMAPGPDGLFTPRPLQEHAPA